MNVSYLNLEGVANCQYKKTELLDMPRIISFKPSTFHAKVSHIIVVEMSQESYITEAKKVWRV